MLGNDLNSASGLGGGDFLIGRNRNASIGSIGSVCAIAIAVFAQRSECRAAVAGCGFERISGGGCRGASGFGIRLGLCPGGERELDAAALRLASLGAAWGIRGLRFRRALCSGTFDSEVRGVGRESLCTSNIHEVGPSLSAGKNSASLVHRPAGAALEQATVKCGKGERSVSGFMTTARRWNGAEVSASR